MSHAAAEVDAGKPRGGRVGGNLAGGTGDGCQHGGVRWIQEMNKGRQGVALPVKTAQAVQFSREAQSGTGGVATSNSKSRQNVQHGRKTYQKFKDVISLDNVINGTYSIGKKLGEGSFGVIYQGTSVHSKELVAIKFEPKKTDAPQLVDEHRFYRMINPAVGFPKCYYFGREGPYNVLCIELLGPSLEDLFDLCGRKFSVKTVCMAAKQMLARIWTIHENRYIYRDIKPDNFLIGRVSKVQEDHLDVYNSMPSPPNVDRKIVDYYRSLRGSILDKHSPECPHPASIIYIVDFGMAKQYLDPYTQAHIPYREKKSLSGTARYMSVNTHLGIEQSRRDDLEALGHVLMYFLRGSLPWQGLRGATNKQKYEKIGGKKQSTLIRSLCAGYPKEFETYLAYTRSLKFSETPNYMYLIKLFDNVLDKIGEKDDGVFDWMIEMDHQAEKNRLRENAWKSRDERDYRNACSKSWQHQYYSNLVSRQGHPPPPPPLPADLPSKRISLIQKKRSLALDAYRASPPQNLRNGVPRQPPQCLPNPATAASSDSVISPRNRNGTPDPPPSPSSSPPPRIPPAGSNLSPSAKVRLHRSTADLPAPFGPLAAAQAHHESSPQSPKSIPAESSPRTRKAQKSAKKLRDILKTKWKKFFGK